MKKLALLLLLGFVLAACMPYIPPEKKEIKNEQVYQKPFDDVWAKIIKWTAVKNIPIKTIEKVSGIIASEYGLQVDQYSTILDCGTKATIQYIDKEIANINIVVEKIDSNATRVIFNIFGNITLSYTDPTTKRMCVNDYNCYSTGK